MYIEIHFPNEDMRNAFIKGLVNAGYNNNDYSIQNNIVYITFDRPRTKQPYTRTSFIEELMQEHNQRNVELFNNITEGLTGIIDKLYLLRQESPDYYNEILKVGRPKQRYEIYNTLKMYLD